MKDKEFIELFNEAQDCPEKIIKMAKTQFQKAVAVEFTIQDNRMRVMENNINWIKKISWGIFATVILGTLGQYVLQYVVPWVQACLG